MFRRIIVVFSLARAYNNSCCSHAELERIKIPNGRKCEVGDRPVSLPA